MSGHPKHGGNGHGGGRPSGGSPGQQSAPPPKQQPGRKKEMRADFLLGFHQQRPAHQRPQQAYAPPRRSRNSGRPYGGGSSAPVAFCRGRFVQSAFRLLVEEVTPDVVEASFNADALVDWASVRRVDLFCEQRPKCPICLEVDMVVPKITKCGHIFCMSCAMRYFSSMQEYNGRARQKCPVCTELVSQEDLISVRTETVQALREGDKVRFVLARRDVNSTVVRLSGKAVAARHEAAAAEGSRIPTSPQLLGLPMESDEGWRLSRFVQLPVGETSRLLDQELKELQDFREICIAEGDTEFLPGISTSTTVLKAELEEHKKRSKTSSAFEEEMLLPPPQEPLAPEDDAAAATRSSPSIRPEDDPLAELPEGHGSDLSGLGSPIPETSPSASSPSGRSGGLGILFYQVEDGRLVFFDPFFTKLLLHEHGGRWDQLPGELQDVRLERIHEVTLNEDVRKRHRFLSHLPLGSQVTFAEVDLRSHLSKETREHFAEDFLKRRQQRKKDQARSKKEERQGKERAAEEEERYYNSLNLMHPTLVQLPPTKDDFAAPLPGRAADRDESVVGGEEGAAADAAAEETDEESKGPTLADKIKEQMSRKPKSKAKAKDKASEAPPPDSSYFPELGGVTKGASKGKASASAAAPSAVASGSAASSAAGGASSSAWGRNCGSSRVPASAKKAAEPPPAVAVVKDAWDDDSPQAATAEDDDQPSFGAALEAVLRSKADSGGMDEQAEGDVGPSAVAAAGSKKKKGRAGKATTVRLFG